MSLDISHNENQYTCTLPRTKRTHSHDDVIKRKHFRVTGHCAGNSLVTGEFPAQSPVTLSFDVFFDLRLNNRLGKHSWGWWFETPPRSLWRHCYEMVFKKHLNIEAWTKLHFQKHFSWMKIVVFGFKFHRSLFLSVQLTQGSALVRVIFWCQTSDVPLPEPQSYTSCSSLPEPRMVLFHYSDVMVGMMVSHIPGIPVCSGADQRKYQSSAALAFVRGIHRWRWIPFTKGQ